MDADHVGRPPSGCPQQALRDRIAELEHRCAKLGLFKTVTDLAIYGAAVASLEGRLVYVNQAFAAMHGYRPEELTGHSLAMLHTPAQMERVEALNTRLRRTGSYHAEEVWHRHRDGHVFPTLMSGALLLDDDGNPQYLSTTAIDIMSVKQGEKLLRLQRDLCLALSAADSLTQVLSQFLQTVLRIEELDCGGVYLVEEGTGHLHLASAQNVSEAFIQKTAFVPADSPAGRLVHAGRPAYLHHGRLPFQADWLQLERLRAAAVVPVCHSGQVIAAVTVASRTHDALSVGVRNVLEGLASSLGGVVLRLKAQEALSKSEELFRTVADTSLDAMVLLRQNGTVALFNPAAEALFGKRHDEVRGQPFERLFCGKDQSRVREHVRAMLTDQRLPEAAGRTLEVEALQSDSMPIPVELRLSAGPKRATRFVLALIRDIRARRETEQAVRRREALLQAVSFAARRFLAGPSWREVADEVLARLGQACDASRVYIFENHRDEKGALLTSQRHEWAAEGVTPQIDNPELQNFPLETYGFSRWIARLSRGEIISGDVETFPEPERSVLQAQDIRSLVAVPIFVDRNWWGLIGFDECRRNRRWTEAELELLRAAASTLGAAIARERIDQRVRESEENYRTLVESLTDGVTVVAGGKVVYASPAQERIMGCPAEEIMRGDVYRFFPPEYRKKAQARVAAVLKGKKLKPTTYEVIRADGRRILVEVNSTPIRYAGQPGILTVVRDITESRRAQEEQAALREQLLEAQKMQAVGLVAAGLTHDFGNLLAVVRNGLQVLQREALSDSGREALRSVSAALEEAAASTESLLVFSRRLPAARAVLDLGELVRDSTRVLRHLLPKTIKLKVLVEPGENLWINADPNQMRQVLLNLVLNARDALSNNGLLEIRVDATRSGTNDQEYVRLTVRDTGSGIPPALHGRVFDPFFTTKPTGQGTGLGLASVRSIVLDHGGKVELDSQVGRGTTITILLPGIAAPTSERRLLPAPTGGGRTVLLYEPNRHVRRLITASLRAWNYEVVNLDEPATWDEHRLAETGAVLAILSADGKLETAQTWLQHLRSHAPHLPMVVTARTFTPEIETQADDRLILLPKPFQMAELGACLSQLLQPHSDGKE